MRRVRPPVPPGHDLAGDDPEPMRHQVVAVPGVRPTAIESRESWIDYRHAG